MPVSTSPTMDQLRQVVAQHWGYNELRPLQHEAMQAVLDVRDSLVVLPTGGGKSLCYQAPAVLRGGTTVVISPLIALMKDQVDSLQACGIPAVALNSSLSAIERSAYEMELAQGQVRLLFISPERLIQTDLYRLLQRIQVHTFAIDEAHCISHWGHDFRKEYRMLARLREFFPGVSIHAYTATATEQVRRDICTNLALRDPLVLVGDFDRPNLTYRVLPRHDRMKQVLEVLARHDGEAGIIYCPRQRDVDELAEALKTRGYKALPYHAGKDKDERHFVQEEFIAERCDIVVATVAFGMGIDRSNVRFVLHTAMPKSLEHYQQEAGRSGRDGLEAECVLLYSGGDVMTSRSMMQKSAQENQVESEVLASGLRHLDEIDRYCRGAGCRHKALVEYFGQEHDRPSCDACDVCLGDTAVVTESTVIAQKILSCVARVREGFGINHVIGILRGENSEAVSKRAHDKLTTYGLLGEHSKPDLRDWIYQLIGQGVLVQTEDEYPKLRLNAGSWEVMRGQKQVRLIQLVRRKKGEKAKKSSADEISWEGVDRPLFDVLRGVRRALASERQVAAAYLIFADSVLREMARVRPSTLPRVRQISGVGDVKLREFGQRFLDAIKEHCRQQGLAMDVSAGPREGTSLFSVPTAASAKAVPSAPPAPLPRTAPVPLQEAELFRREASIRDAMIQLGKPRNTIVDFLCDYIRRERPASIAAWVPDLTYRRVVNAVRTVGTETLRPILLALGDSVSADEVRLVLAHLAGRGGTV